MQRKACPLTLLTFDADMAPMSFCDPLDNRQAKTGTTSPLCACAIRLKEALKHMAYVLCRNTSTTILDR